MPTLDRAELDDVRLYLNLAWRLGMLHAQMDRGTLKNARITYRGEVAHKNTKLITASFAAGLMETALEEQVNLVNAMALARERGIVIEERVRRCARRLRHLDPDRGHHRAQDLRRRRAPSSASSSSAWSGWARTCSTPTSTARCLIFTHMDRPGLIGFIGRTLGDEGVNIAQMNVGREEQGGEAIGVVNLDSVPSPEALEAVQKHPDILSLSVIKLPGQGETPRWL